MRLLVLIDFVLNIVCSKVKKGETNIVHEKVVFFSFRGLYLELVLMKEYCLIY